MLGQVLVTKQTGADGRRVQTLLHCRAARKSKRNFISPCCSTAPMRRPLIMASTEGGMDIEEVAARNTGKDFQGMD